MNFFVNIQSSCVVSESGVVKKNASMIMAQLVGYKLSTNSSYSRQFPAVFSSPVPSILATFLYFKKVRGKKKKRFAKASNLQKNLLLNFQFKKIHEHIQKRFQNYKNLYSTFTKLSSSVLLLHYFQNGQTF